MEFSKKRGPAFTSPRPVSRQRVDNRCNAVETRCDIHLNRDNYPRFIPHWFNPRAATGHSPKRVVNWPPENGKSRRSRDYRLTLSVLEPRQVVLRPSRRSKGIFSEKNSYWTASVGYGVPAERVPSKGLLELSRTRSELRVGRLLFGVESFFMGEFTHIGAVPDIVAVCDNRIGTLR